MAYEEIFVISRMIETATLNQATLSYLTLDGKAEYVFAIIIGQIVKKRIAHIKSVDPSS